MRLQRSEIAHARLDLDRLAPVPRRRRDELELRIGDRLGDLHRYRFRLNAIREHRRARKRRKFVAAHSARVNRAREAIGRDHRLASAARERPRDFLRAVRARGHRGLRAFLDRDLRVGERERIACMRARTRTFRNDRPDRRLHRFLILVLEPDPVGRARNAGDTHLVDIANKVVVAVPSTDPQRGSFGKVELGR